MRRRRASKLPKLWGGRFDDALGTVAVRRQTERLVLQPTTLDVTGRGTLKMATPSEPNVAAPVRDEHARERFAPWHRLALLTECSTKRRETEARRYRGLDGKTKEEEQKVGRSRPETPFKKTAPSGAAVREIWQSGVRFG